MKQHITIDQFDELSSKGKAKLREWWKPQIGDLYYGNSGLCPVCDMCEEEYGINLEDYKSQDALLSIGQMMQFLNESDKHNWKVQFRRWDDAVGIDEFNVKLNYEGELCDVLWNIVKEVLNK